VSNPAAKIIAGLRRGVQVHTPHGWFKNGTAPSAKQADFLNESGYKLRPDKDAPAEEDETNAPVGTTAVSPAASAQAQAVANLERNAAAKAADKGANAA
jgi:hypothetical protein